MSKDIVYIGRERIGEESDISLSEARQLLSSDENERANRFKFPIHRNRFTRARAFLRLTLAHIIGTDPNELRFGYESRGKPFLVDYRETGFNLSHSEDFAVVAVSRSIGSLGLDIEDVSREVGFEAICDHYFSESESAWILASSLEPEAKKQRFFEVWTAKEARMKLFGDGMALDPRSIEVELVDEPVGFIQPKPTDFELTTFQYANVVGALVSESGFELEWLDSKRDSHLEPR